MKLGIVLATGDFATAAALSLAARRARHEVGLFTMDAGCAALAAAPALAQQLLDDDVEITACSNSSIGIDFIDGIARGSQDDHAALVSTSDRLVALT